MAHDDRVRLTKPFPRIHPILPDIGSTAAHQRILTENRAAPGTLEGAGRGGKRRHRFLTALLLVGGFWLSAFSFAQSGRFNANTYYGQCLRFEAGGDLETARQSCLNALSVDPRLGDAALALARIDVALGNLEEAETRLSGLTTAPGTGSSAEPYVLLAEIALRGKRYSEAQGFLDDASARLAGRYNRALDGRRNFLAGRLAEARGEVAAALEHYGAAIRADGLEAPYRLADAELRYKLGDLAGAAGELASFERLTGEKNPKVYALLGHVAWAMSDLEGAAEALDTAIILRGSSAREATQRDLRDLALIYYAQGDVRNGNRALREADNPFGLFSQNLLWLLLLAALLALHLVGESRIGAGSSLELREGPEPWTVGQVYLTLLTALSVAGVGTALYGTLRFGNPLAFVTPVQMGEARALFFALLALVLVGLALWRVRANGWRPLETLMGGGVEGGANYRAGSVMAIHSVSTGAATGTGGASTGVGTGLLVLGLVLAAQVYAPWRPFWGFYLDLSRFTPPLLAAVVADATRVALLSRLCNSAPRQTLHAPPRHAFVERPLRACSRRARCADADDRPSPRRSLPAHPQRLDSPVSPIRAPLGPPHRRRV